MAKKELNASPRPMYFKLGSKAISNFYDPTSRTKIVNRAVVMVDGRKVLASKRFVLAKQNGHIVEATREEYEKYEKRKTQAKEIEKVATEEVVDETPTLTKAELIDLIMEFEGDHTKASLKTMKLDQLKDLLKDLEENAEDDEDEDEDPEEGDEDEDEDEEDGK